MEEEEEEDDMTGTVEGDWRKRRGERVEGGGKGRKEGVGVGGKCKV